LQIGLTAGAGIILDVFQRNGLQIDFGYTWVHSNMGLNSDDDDSFFEYEDAALDGTGERENFEYYHNIATIGVAYMFGYNSNLKRKGKSTNKKSNK